MRNIFTNLGVLFVSCLVGLSLCEVSLRLFYPKFRHLADPQVRQDARRLWAHKPNNRNTFRNPDTLSMIPLHHNNFGLRQHRNFSAADLASATNIGVFGDSWTENRRMAAPYSFTEPLDYLLNRSGQRFNVLNFGVENYGTGQSFLHYADFRYAQELDYVVYVYCDNDLDDLYKRGLFDTDDAGHLVKKMSLPSPIWVRGISRLHLSYLVLDGSERLFSAIGEWGVDNRERRREHERRISAKEREYGSWGWKQAVFRQLLRRWKHLVESNGNSFYVVTLPEAPRDPFLATLLAEEEIESIDLYDCFDDLDLTPKDRQEFRPPYRFKNDGHWNEAGNHVAAGCLYRALEKELGLAAQTEEELEAALLQYYAAFGGWMPMNAGEGGEVHPSAATAGIREKYEAFGGLTAIRKNLKERIEGSDKRIIASHFDVYFDGKRLTYIKERCNPTDLQRPFFLSVVPVDESDPPEHRVQYSYIHTRGGFKFFIDQNRCIALKRLPHYPIRHLWTGQYDRNESILWEGEFAIDRNNDRGEAELVPAVGKRMLASDFDVYLDGKQLTYVKKGCRPSDWQAPFFLYVFPVATNVLPPDRVEDGYDSLDFNKSCTIERMLPAYAIARIRTGQRLKQEYPWKGAFATDPDNSGDEEAELVPGLGRRIIASDFDVYLDGRRLIYKKEDCRSVNWDGKFFLHIVPVDTGHLPVDRVHYGFANLDFSHHRNFFRNKGFRLNEFGCTRRVHLPDYAIHRIRTGQFAQYDDGSFLNLWEGEFSIEQDVGVGAHLAGD